MELDRALDEEDEEGSEGENEDYEKVPIENVVRTIKSLKCTADELNSEHLTELLNKLEIEFENSIVVHKADKSKQSSITYFFYPFEL